MFRQQIPRFTSLRLQRLLHDLPHDPSGLLEKGRAEENVYFRQKQVKELIRMKKKLERLERIQEQLEDKLEKTEELLDKLNAGKNASDSKKKK